jgi:heme exporter protein B
MKSIGVFKKDWASELRTRYAINALAMFILVTISVILFSVGQEVLSPELTGGLLWVVIFFSAMSGLARGFVSEEERGTTLTLHLLAKPFTIFAGKFLFNLILVFLMNIVILILFLGLFNGFAIENWAIMSLAFLFGNVGIAVSSTIIAAIISKANTKGTLYPVLSFPILLPLILILIELTNYAIVGMTISEAFVDLAILIIYDIIMITASFMLFDFIWNE